MVFLGLFLNTSLDEKEISKDVFFVPIVYRQNEFLQMNSMKDIVMYKKKIHVLYILCYMYI